MKRGNNWRGCWPGPRVAGLSRGRCIATACHFRAGHWAGWADSGFLMELGAECSWAVGRGRFGDRVSRTRRRMQLANRQACPGRDLAKWEAFCQAHPHPPRTLPRPAGRGGALHLGRVLVDWPPGRPGRLHGGVVARGQNKHPLFFLPGSKADQTGQGPVESPDRPSSCPLSKCPRQPAPTALRSWGLTACRPWGRPALPSHGTPA